MEFSICEAIRYKLLREGSFIALDVDILLSLNANYETQRCIF